MPRLNWTPIAVLGLALLACRQPQADTPSVEPEEAGRDGAAVDPTLEALQARGRVANPYRAGRSMTVARNGIVASSHVLASQAGLDMLRSGGSAMDAAVATAFTLAVVEPMMTGIGGDAWVLYYEAKTGKVYALNGSGRAPAGLTRKHFADQGIETIDDKTWESVTVPGAVDAYATALSKFGKKPLAEVMAPAIGYAENGFPVTEVVHGWWVDTAEDLKKRDWTRKTYLPEGRPPKVGEVFKNPNLATTLRAIAKEGPDGFYGGAVADEIVRHAKETGGFLSKEDLASHTSTWVEPISTDYRGYEVIQCPPNGQGMGVLSMLEILEGYDLASMEHDSAAYQHLLIEAKKLAYADLYAYVADPEKAQVPVEKLLDSTYAGARRAKIDPMVAAQAVDPGLPMGNDTVYLTAIDAEGNAASFITSIYDIFGSKIVAGNTGVMLHNRGAGFTLEKGHPNEYAPGKRPYHTIIPGMILKGGKLYMSYGLMGGAMQPQGHVQFLTAHLDHGFGIQEAVDMPRWRHYDGKRVKFEYGYREDVVQDLRQRGHEIEWGDYKSFGGAQVIVVDPETGSYFGASDPRKDGAALGY